MSQLIDNLNLIVSIKSDIKSAIENKGVDMTGVSFPGYASKIGEISGGGGVNPSGTLEISQNGVYDVYSYASASVNVPQSVTGFTEKEITEGIQIVNLSNSASFIASNAFNCNTTIQTVNLPNCISVGEQAFYSCSNLKTVSLPECKTISSRVFSNCTTLQSIYLPNVEYIGDIAFSGCISLSGVLSFPLCSYIGSATFSDCSNITSVYIPLVKRIYSGTFNRCSKLSSVYMSSCEYISDWAFARTVISEVNYPLCYEVRNAAFLGCSSLKKASFPNCYSFGGYAGLFNDDISLEELTLNMNNYLDFASNYTSFGLSKTKLASGIGSIYVQSWHYDKYITAKGWSSLSERFVSVPVSSMLSFSNGLLSGYTNIIDYSFNSYIGVSYSEVIDVSLSNCEFVLPSPNVSPPRNAFRENCNNLQTLYIGNMSLCYSEFMMWHSNIKTVDLPVCTSIDNNAFYNCSNLTTANLPNVEYIGNNAFAGCSLLTQVSLPMCDYIGTNAFYNCSSLSIITIGYSGVCRLDNSNVFGNTQITSSTGSIYVPTSLVDAYKSATNWSYFSTQIFPISV